MKNVAILFAVNSYSGSPLNGCLNDQDDFIAKWKSLGIDIEVDAFREDQVTHDRVLKELQVWANTLHPTSKGQISVTVHYSGHGTYDKSNRETDGFSEALYPFDGVPIFDYELTAVLRLFHPWIDLFIILDSCFSGGMDRFTLSGDPFAPRPKFFRIHSHVPDQTHKIHRPFLKMIEPNWTLLSGCGDRQTSADFYYNGKYNGALSRFVIDSYRPGQSKEQLFHKVRNHLPSGTLDQRPELLGNSEWMNTGCFGVPVKKCFLKFW